MKRTTATQKCWIFFLFFLFFRSFLSSLFDDTIINNIIANNTETIMAALLPLTISSDDEGETITKITKKKTKKTQNEDIDSDDENDDMNDDFEFGGLMVCGIIFVMIIMYNDCSVDLYNS